MIRMFLSGERRVSFPSFFWVYFLLFFVVCSGWFILPSSAPGQETGKKDLSLFDHLAREATLLNKRGKFDDVIALLAPQKGHPQNDNALFFNELGIAYRNKGRLKDAEQAYHEALKRDPENPVVQKNLGDVYILQKDYPKAVELYRIVLDANPLFEQAHYGLGLAYYRLEKYPEALQAFETVLRLNPQDEGSKKFQEAIRKKLREQKK